MRPSVVSRLSRVGLVAGAVSVLLLAHWWASRGAISVSVIHVGDRHALPALGQVKSRLVLPPRAGGHGSYALAAPAPGQMALPSSGVSNPYWLPSLSEALSEAELVSLLDDERAAYQAAAARQLVADGALPSRAVPSLVRILEDDSFMARREAARALGWTEGSASELAATALIEALSHPDPSLRARAAGSLARLGAPGLRARPVLRAGLHGEAPMVQLAYAAALGDMSRTWGMVDQVLLDALLSGEPQLRAAGATGLGRCMDLARPLLDAVARDGNDSERAAVAYARRLATCAGPRD